MAEVDIQWKGGPALFSDLAEELRESGRAAFVAAHAPAFLLLHGADLTGATPSDTAVPVGRANTAATTFHVFSVAKRVEGSEAAITLGRGEENDLVVLDDTISRAHAGFEVTHGAWRVFDLGSSNGSFVSDEPLARREEGGTAIAPRANLRFGSVQMKFMPVEDFIQFAEAFIGPVA
jgi:hypothetical protein